MKINMNNYGLIKFISYNDNSINEFQWIWSRRFIYYE